MASKLMRSALAAALVLGVMAGPAAAQINTGSIAGTVKDTQGGVIPGATVILTSEARGTKSAPVVTNESGDFQFVNMAADTYTIDVTMPAFKNLRRSGVSISPGSRITLGTLTIEVGGATETVEVRDEAPQIQASTGERSFTIATESVANLPLASRSFAELINLTPGVVNGNRAGDSASTGGGANNFMMDGVSTMDSGSNRLMVAVNVESIAEVKVLTSSYQAEYGRSSGLQVTAVTKSGSNRFHGSVYDVERNSDWNANSKVNILNLDQKTTSKAREWGYSVGGPVGKPGGSNKLFFFYAQEFQPRTAGNNTVRFRLPTALERAGDFSQTTDNNGNPFPYIWDRRTNLPCVTTPTGDHSGCFQDGGVLGRIPASRLYQTGLNILNRYPLPNIADVPAGQNYNFQLVRPEESLTSWQPVVRVDYQPTSALRGTFKYAAWGQPRQTINGSLPGFNDTRMNHPIVPLFSASVNYTVNSTTFLEATVGHTSHRQAGCALNGQGANFCTSGFPMNPVASRLNSGLENLPFLFPDANIVDPSYYQFDALNGVDTPVFDGTRVNLPPNFNFGGRVSNGPPNNSYPGFADHVALDDFAVSVTKVSGRHTFKGGFYQQHSAKLQNQGAPFGSLNFNNDTNNPLDSQFPYANAALGVFQQFQQASKFVEGQYVYDNREFFIQDNWKINSRLTLDYGVRFVNQEPQYDRAGQASNFLPEKYDINVAPVLYVAGCANGVFPCSGTNRQAMNPLTGQFLGPNTNLAIGSVVPGTGSSTNGLFLSGQGIAKTTYTWPTLGYAPRFGAAFDLTGEQKIVLRGGGGLFFDRPSGNSVFAQVTNPPTLENVTVRYGELQTLGQGGLTTRTPPQLSVFEYDADLPASWQWNGGVQMQLPWAVALDVSYVGQHQYDILQNNNLNAVDYGTAFLPQFQDPTAAANVTPGARAVAQDQMRPYRGFAAINQTSGYLKRTYHSVQVSFQRRFRNGLSFGFNDVMGLYDRQNLAPRLQHRADGSFFVRDDQAEAERLLGNNNPQAHIFKANFVWDLPDLNREGGMMRVLGMVVNDWQMSGIWTAATAGTYTVNFNYNNGGGNVNLTGSPDYGARIRVVGDPGKGCSSNSYQQFNTAAFQGPLTGSVGLESGNGYLRGCFSSVLDLTIQRTFRLGGGRTFQLRADMFNAPNEARITGRNTQINLNNPNDPITATNLPYDANGNLLVDASGRPTRGLPRGAGFGVANGYQNPRSIQLQARFTF